MEKMNNELSIYHVIERFFTVDIPGAMTVIMAAIVTAEILGRLILNRSFQGLVDMAEVLVVQLAFLSLAGVQADRSHITVDVLAEKLKHRKAGPVFDCVVQGFSMVAMGFVLGELVWYMIRAYKTGMTTVTLFWPIWPFVVGMIIGGLFYVLRMGVQFKESFLKTKTFKKGQVNTLAQSKTPETSEEEVKS
jgi:TRAP-type C4-dicarboxylate transport system permease small subunit